jgi:hypothetical protein
LISEFAAVHRAVFGGAIRTRGGAREFANQPYTLPYDVQTQRLCFCILYRDGYSARAGYDGVAGSCGRTAARDAGNRCSM